MKIDDLSNVGGVASPGAKARGRSKAAARHESGRAAEDRSDQRRMSGLHKSEIANATGIDATQRAEKSTPQVEVAEGIAYHPDAAVTSRAS
jgi:hypothetical protein